MYDHPLPSEGHLSLRSCVLLLKILTQKARHNRRGKEPKHGQTGHPIATDRTTGSFSLIQRINPTAVPTNMHRSAQDAPSRPHIYQRSQRGTQADRSWGHAWCTPDSHNTLSSTVCRQDRFSACPRSNDKRVPDVRKTR
eukprot:960769-Amphidinium_carterae.1